MISSGSTLAEDIRYGLAHWQGLTRFLEDGCHSACKIGSDAILVQR